MTVGNLRKPRWWALALAQELGDELLPLRSRATARGRWSTAGRRAAPDGAIDVLLWNGTLDQSKQDGRPAARPRRSSCDLPRGRVNVARVDAEHSNLARHWHAERPWPTETELAELRANDRLDDRGPRSGRRTCGIEVADAGHIAPPMDDGRVTLMVELWFESEPQLDLEVLVAAVPGTDRVPSRRPAAGRAPALRAPLRRRRRVHHHGHPRPRRGRRQRHRPDTTQTWDWPDADNVLARCTHQLLIAEFYGRAHPHQERIDAYLPTLRAAIELTSPVAAACPTSDRVVRPTELLEDELAAVRQRAHVPRRGRRLDADGHPRPARVRAARRPVPLRPRRARARTRSARSSTTSPPTCSTAAT